MTETDSASVNEHCLNNIMKLSQTREVTAAEDIFDSRGNKLWAKDAAITPELQERLLARKLRKPLEATLQVADGVGPQQILQEAQKQCDTVPALAGLMGTQQAKALETLAQVRLAPPLTLLLTTADAQNSGGLSHAVQVALVSISVGLHAGKAANDLATLALGGMLHDVGELYINPDYMHSSRRLTPEEWKHVAVHPRVGEVVLSQLGCVPPAVIRAVSEHHERLDGNGYPRQHSGGKLSLAGQIVGLADLMGSIIRHRDNPLARASLALRLVPGEHAYELISVIATLHRHAGGSDAGGETKDLRAAIDHTAQVGIVIHDAIAESARLLEANQRFSPNAQELALRLQLRLRMLLQALRASGVHEYASHLIDGKSYGDASIDMALELEMVSHEIAWRLRDMARELTLRTLDQPRDVILAFAPLQALLDKAP